MSIYIDKASPIRLQAIATTTTTTAMNSWLNDIRASFMNFYL